MSILDFFRSRPKNTASVAKERLRIIVAQERAQQGRGRPDYLPLLRREILEVIKKYVNVDPDAIDIHVEQDGDSEVLGVIPESPGVLTASNAGVPVILDDISPAGQAYEDAVARLAGETRPMRFLEAQKKGFLARIFGS